MTNDAYICTQAKKFIFFLNESNCLTSVYKVLIPGMMAHFELNSIIYVSKVHSCSVVIASVSGT
jgi:hypothetical protein